MTALTDFLINAQTVAALIGVIAGLIAVIELIRERNYRGRREEFLDQKKRVEDRIKRGESNGG